MKATKEEVEKQLGFAISDKDFAESRERAENKLNFIISRFGDSGGKRREAGYLIELIFEDVMANVFSEATIVVTANMLNMEKGTRQNAGAPLVTDHIVARVCE